MVVDVKVTSTEKKNKAFRENKIPRLGDQRDTRKKKVRKAVVVPIIISHDGTSTKTQSDDGRTLHPTSRSTGCEWHKMSFAIMWSLSGRSSTKGAGSPRPGEKPTPRSLKLRPKEPHKESLQSRSEESSSTLTLNSWVLCVRPSCTPPPHDVRLTSAARGNPNF